MNRPRMWRNLRRLWLDIAKQSYGGDLRDSEASTFRRIVERDLAICARRDIKFQEFIIKVLAPQDSRAADDSLL